MSGILVFAALTDAVAGCDITLVFNGPGLEQGLPVSRAGFGPLGADQQEFGPFKSQAAAELGEADIVAGHQADGQAADLNEAESLSRGEIFLLFHE